MELSLISPIILDISDAPYAPGVKRRVHVISFTPYPQAAIIQLHCLISHFVLKEVSNEEEEIDIVEEPLPYLDWFVWTESNREKYVDLSGELVEMDENGEFPSGIVAIPEVDFIWTLIMSGKMNIPQVLQLFIQRIASRGNFDIGGVAIV